MIVWVAIWTPPGVVSTRLPSPALTVRTSPLGAIVNANGPLSLPFAVTSLPAYAVVVRCRALGIAAIRLISESAT